MIPQLPFYVSGLFILTAFLTLILFWKAGKWPSWLLWLFLGWLILQGLLAYSGFYLPSDKLPPNFLFLVIPALLFVLTGVFLPPMNSSLRSIDMRSLVLVHIVRIPVEIILYLLYKYGTIPQLTTFDGNNFDILAGLSAPLIYFWGFKNGEPKKSILIIWNVICLGLLINIVSTAILSAPFPFQMFGFEQPNIAVFYFPIIWLPGLIVPMVLYAHLASLKILFTNTGVGENQTN